ncbi:von Willebrand factor A domain-containing protein 1-like isoform X1 [Acipenser ruthenus]|uniref:von Willebrand factor A domain-containing protein 1-like isoform X1 n=1 Tax=Acipenser ruthenus TaxID=7906 RepID=UPI002741121D|nr:von Willebrand factor A domain-containing protein 1-like isoform X1 [Acipenser ruthenus]
MNFRVYVTLYCAIYVLTAVAKEIEIIEKRGVLPRCAAPLFPVDVLLLLDSSSSVTAWEFSQFLSLLMRLSSALPVGPVQVGLLSVSDFPVLEFRIGQHQTAAALQGSLGVLRQRGGDTNSGLALEWARRQGFAPGWGSRAGAHRVVLWITDGMSTDEVELPARLLKEAGVRVLLVSTGRSDHGIRTVASDHSSMFFTDTDNLPEISVQLCEAIVGSDSQSTGLSVFDIQSETASVSWPRFLIGSEGRYILEVTSWSAGRQSRVYQELHWESHGATLRNLQANTPYWLSLTSTSSSQGQRVLWGNFTTTALPGAAETLPVSSNLTASSANVREKGNNPNTLTDKTPAVSSNLSAFSVNVREKGNNPNTLTDKKPAVSSNLTASSANVREKGNNPNTLTDKKPAVSSNLSASSANVREKGNNPNTLTDKKPAVSSNLSASSANVREKGNNPNTLTDKKPTDFSKLLNLKENANQVNALTEKKPAAFSANVREKGNNPNTLTDKKPAVSSNLPASSANVREKGNNPNTLTDKKPAVTLNLSVSSANTRQPGRYPNTLTDKTLTARPASPRSLILSFPSSPRSVSHYQVIFGVLPRGEGGTVGSGVTVGSLQVKGEQQGVWLTQLRPDTAYLITVTAHYRGGGQQPFSVTARTWSERLSSPQHLMLTDVTSSSLVASWAEPEEQEVRQYKVRHIDSSGKIQEHSLPGHVRTVYLRDLAPRSAHVICVSALYKHGRSAETCAKKRTLPAPVNKRRHIPYRLCAPYFKCKC